MRARNLKPSLFKNELLAVADLDPAEDVENCWAHVGEVAAQCVWDIANRAKDRTDERLDAMRTHNGMTLEEFLNGKA